jgi:hypothetical protein
MGTPRCRDAVVAESEMLDFTTYLVPIRVILGK